MVLSYTTNSLTLSIILFLKAVGDGISLALQSIGCVRRQSVSNEALVITFIKSINESIKPADH